MERIELMRLKTIWRRGGRETLIQWPASIRNRDYCTGSEGTQWNLALEKKMRKKIFFFLKIVAVFFPTQLQNSFPLYSWQTMVERGIFYHMLPEREAYTAVCWGHWVNPLKPKLNPICYLLALLGAHHLLHVSRIRVKSLTLRLLMSYIYIYIYMEHPFLMFLDHTQRRSSR